MGSEPFGFDQEDFDRVIRGAGEQLRSALGQFGNLFNGAGGRSGWSAVFDDVAGRRATAEPTTTGATGDGAWVVYAVDDDGGARVEQVYATELDALRGNKHNTDGRRTVRFLPYGMPVSVLDAPEDPPSN